MLKFFVFLFFILISVDLYSLENIRTIHVIVALCDNENQGIVPVPAKIGNGQDPANNLYWGCRYGVKNFFKKLAPGWRLIRKINSGNEDILERLLFKHKSGNVYMLADAYDGAEIKQATIDLLEYANGQKAVKIKGDDIELFFGGKASMIAYTGHDGLMDFGVNPEFKEYNGPKKDVIILACYSKNYFSSHIKRSGANPLLWTNGLMAPEAYTLAAAIDGWIAGESGMQVRERAAKAYYKYQKCGMRGARNLFSTGY